MTTNETIITILVITIATMLTRFLPFIIFPDKKDPPKYIQYLGRVLPYAIMGMLVIYCLKDAFFSNYHGILEGISILVIILLHKWKKNTLISIAGGTAFYMLLIQNF